jgi:hypothetical protein
LSTSSFLDRTVVHIIQANHLPTENTLEALTSSNGTKSEAPDGSSDLTVAEQRLAEAMRAMVSNGELVDAYNRGPKNILHPLLSKYRLPVPVYRQLSGAEIGSIKLKAEESAAADASPSHPAASAANYSQNTAAAAHLLGADFAVSITLWNGQTLVSDVCKMLKKAHGNAAQKALDHLVSES